jgi:proteasome accessory factor C
MSDVHERLRRLLFLVPYVAKRQGITVADLAKACGMTRDALIADLDLLTLVGRPPFQPNDYIDLHVENDRVYVLLDQRLSKPPRLTAAEAAALKSAAELLSPSTGGALQSALEKLERVLPKAIRDRYREMERKVDASAGAPAELGPLTGAISERREVEFEYFSQGRGATEARTVRPFELLSHRGHWYLSAYCCTREDVRLFRLDRIRALNVTERVFEPMEHARKNRVPNPAARDASVRVRFSASVAPYVLEQFGVDARPTGDGGVEVKVSGDAERWLVQWVCSFGGEAEVVEPAWARQIIARAVEASLESH